MLTTHFTRRSRGMSLIELLVAITIGLLVVGAIVSLVVATMRTNTDNMRSVRLTQEMRGAMQLITRDLRRAGFSQNALEDIGAGVTANPFLVVDYDDGDNDGFDDDNCILYSSDSDIGGMSSIDGIQETAERHGVRYNSNDLAIEYKNGSDSGCDVDTDWVAMTDASSVEITALSFGDVDGDGLFPRVEFSGGCPISFATVREIQIILSGRLADDPAVQKTIQDTVRVRNDLIEETPCPP